MLSRFAIRNRCVTASRRSITSVPNFINGKFVQSESTEVRRKRGVDWVRGSEVLSVTGPKTAEYITVNDCGNGGYYVGHLTVYLL